MDNSKKLSLHRLVQNDNFLSEVCLRLTNPNQKDHWGYTLLHEAVNSYNSNDRIVQFLLHRGADVNATTPLGFTPLHFVVSARKRDVAVALIDAGASVNAKDSYGRTALHFAVGRQCSNPQDPVHTIETDMWILETLLIHPDICMNPVDRWGETPLMWAVKEENLEAVNILLKFGANPSISCAGNRTPLHEMISAESVEDANYDIAYTLLLRGAGIYCKDHSGQTPVDILIRRVHDVTFEFATRCVMLIAFYYKIKKTLKTKLRQNPLLINYFDDCNNEVRLMKKLVIYDKVTLHDFALDCFQVRVEDPVREIFIPVVEFLLSGFFRIYFAFVLLRLSRSDLLNVLEKAASNNSYNNFIPPDASNIIIYRIISYVYDESVILKKRRSRIKSWVQKMI